MSRIYNPDFVNQSYRQGDTIQVRRQNQFEVGDGPVATPQDIIETVESITIAHQFNTLIAYTSKTLTLDIEDFTRMYIRPAIQRIISKFEFAIARQAILDVYAFTGTANTPINSFAQVDLVGAKLLELGVDIASDAYLALAVREASTLKAGLQNQFTPVLNEEIARYSALGHLSYFDVFQSQNIAEHVAGAGPRLTPGDTLTVNGAVASGSAIVLAGATINVTNYFVPGDLISIAGVTSVNPLTNESTGQNMQFVITANASSNGAGAITVQVSPSIISDTSNPLQNVSNAVPNGAAVTVVPTYTCNVGYPSRGLDICTPPLGRLEVPFCSVANDPESGLSMRVAQAGDILADQNYMRLDLLCGFKWHPQYAVKLIS